MVRMHVGVNKRRFRWISTATLILIIGFFLCSGYSVYRDVRQTQRDVRYLIGHEHDISSAKGRVALLGALEDLGRSASRAHSSLGLTVASTVIGWIPSVGPDVGNVSALLTDEVVIAREGRTLVQAFGQFSTALQRTQGGSPRSFNDLVDAVKQANQEVKSLPTVQSGFLNPLGAIEQQAQTKVDRLRTLLSDSTNALQVVRVLLGETSAQNILVLPENNAEMREQGSVLSYALLQAHAQHFHLLQSGHSYSLNLSHPVPYVASPGAKAYYLVDGPNSYWQSINISGDFATTGATAAAMFKAATGIRVDAVVALDVPAMAALTGVGGALHLAGQRALLARCAARGAGQGMSSARTEGRPGWRGTLMTATGRPSPETIRTWSSVAATTVARSRTRSPGRTTTAATSSGPRASRSVTRRYCL